MKLKYYETPLPWKDLLRQGLKEDGWEWDWTSLGLMEDGEKMTRAQVLAKSEGIWAGGALIAALDQIASEISETQVKPFIQTGEEVKSNTLVLEWRAPARVILALERPFLNLAAYVGGIATATRQLVNQVQKECPQNTPRIAATRKSLPGYRDIATVGILAGGGFSHRFNLSGGVLIKENHIAVAGSITKAIQGVRAIAPHGLKIEVEVRSLDELQQALEQKVGGVLLDNFTSEEVRAALKLLSQAKPRPFLEVSGGLNESTISQYALDGVDVLSVGALTHSVRALDLSLLIP